MKKQKLSMEDAFQTLPEIPQDFEKWCYSFLPKIAIYYRRDKEVAHCQCGKCGEHFMVEGKPSRNERAECPRCGNAGYYEWKKVVRLEFFDKSMYLLQCAANGDLVMRYFRIYQDFRQGRRAKVELIEYKRIFLTLGDVYYFNNEEQWRSSKGWYKCWDSGKGNARMDDGVLYGDWRAEIKKSNLKYCDVDAIWKISSRAVLNILLTFANNPALEMYVKAGMSELVDHMIRKEGKTQYINRRGKTINEQFRLKDKKKIKRFIESKGNITMLEILLIEEKMNMNYTVEQEAWLKLRFDGYYNEKKEVLYLLQYMSLQQLINRVEKYKGEEKITSEHSILLRYYDYLRMREELGYDMTNEVFLYPKNLKKKHDEMVKERNAREDELYIAKRLVKYENIARKYKALCKKYAYEDAEYVIRPAKDAEEIIMEGRKLHHCVGRDQYLKKHNKGESTILFLRKKDSPNKPYYTIEIQGNKILQWYGLKDKKPDKEIIEPWLNNYVERLQMVRKAKKQVLQAAG